MACKWCHNPESISFEYQIAYQAERCVNCLACTTVCAANTVADSNHVFDKDTCILCGKCENICPNSALKFYGKKMSLEDAFHVVMEDKDFYDGIGGVTLSGGECLMQWEFCLALLKRVKAAGINTAVDTCGFVSQQIMKEIAPYTDTFLYDVKAITPEVHVNCTGKDNRQILDNLNYLDGLGKRIEIRIPFVPGFNSGEIEKIADCIKDLKNVSGVRLLKYHDFATSRYRSLNMPYLSQGTPIPTNQEMQAARDVLLSRNLPVLI